jgi:hypothetical protein
VKDQILKLRAEGKLYREIAQIVGCDIRTVSYHCNAACGKRMRVSNSVTRLRRKIQIKKMFGNKCQNCNYDKCINALCFHHIDPSKKEGELARIIKQNSLEKALKEASKCLLLCANCHLEFHAGMLSLDHLKLLKPKLPKKRKCSPESYPIPKRAS